ncbi:hypothetical protein RRG08_043994 [Elysia crispata]|uniref:Uncharacterized protein n=1 Tax=Elysia crispata TaxID=231223 RepID=A0AAE1DGF6_9GAST|nr:hypothetical protein RRG08_043994 [Elysia crispata]
MLNSILKWGILEQDNSAARDSLSREALPERLVFKPLTHPTVDGDREYFGLLSLFAMKTRIGCRLSAIDIFAGFSFLIAIISIMSAGSTSCRWRPRYLGRVLGLDHGDFGQYVLQRRQYVLQRRQYVLQRREYVLQRREYVLQRREYVLQRREYVLQRREYVLQRREYVLQRREYVLQRREYVLQRREYVLQRREYVLQRREYVLQRREYVLQRREYVLQRREKGMCVTKARNV